MEKYCELDQVRAGETLIEIVHTYKHIYYMREVMVSPRRMGIGFTDHSPPLI